MYFSFDSSSLEKYLTHAAEGLSTAAAVAATLGAATPLLLQSSCWPKAAPNFLAKMAIITHLLHTSLHFVFSPNNAHHNNSHHVGQEEGVAILRMEEGEEGGYQGQENGDEDLGDMVEVVCSGKMSHYTFSVIHMS